MTPAQKVAADLRYLADRYDDLLDSRLKGTARPWQQPHIAPNEDRDDLARIERADRSDRAIGEHPAPLHIDVLDALIDLLSTAEDLANRVAQEAGVDRLPPVSGGDDSPVPHLLHAAKHLRHIGHQLFAHVAAEVDRLRATVDRHLGELTTGQKLLAECPWCRGVTPTHPGGGDFTLRVRQDSDGAVLIVCESGGCEPSSADCGLRYRGHPAWDLHTEGEWLAARIEAHGQEEAA